MDEYNIGECFLEVLQQKLLKKKWVKYFSVIDSDSPFLLTLYDNEKKENVKKIFNVKNCRIYNSVYELRKKKRKNVASTLLIFFEIVNTNRKKKKKEEIKFYFRFKDYFHAEEFIFEMKKAPGAALIDDSFVLRKSLKQRKKIFEKKKSVVLQKMSKLRGFDEDDFDIKESIEVLSNRVLFKYMYMSHNFSPYSDFRWRKLYDEENKKSVFVEKIKKWDNYDSRRLMSRYGRGIKFFLFDSRVYEGLMKNGNYNIKELITNPVLEQKMYDKNYLRKSFLKSVYYFLWLMSWEESMSKLSRDVFRYSILSFWNSYNAGEKIECVLGVVCTNYFLDWNESNLVIPLCLTRGGGICTVINYIDNFDFLDLFNKTLFGTSNNISFCMEELTSVLHDYNTKYTFLPIGEERTKENERTRSDFFREFFRLFGCVDFRRKNDEGCYMNFFNNIIQKGKGEMKMKPHRDFVEFFEQVLVKHFKGYAKHGYIVFTSHLQLDEFSEDLRRQCLDIYNCFYEEWNLIRLFDRFFWMNHLMFPDDERYKPKEPKAKYEYKPFATGCVFFDPRETPSGYK